MNEEQTTQAVSRERVEEWTYYDLPDWTELFVWIIWSFLPLSVAIILMVAVAS